MKMKSIETIKSHYYRIAKQLNAPKKYVRFAKTANHDGSPHIEFVNDKYYYVVTERGVELERKQTTDPDEILYWLISDITFYMSSDYELNHRIESEDCRRQLFKKDVELLNGIESHWAEKKKKEYESILKTNPFYDCQ